MRKVLPTRQQRNKRVEMEKNENSDKDNLTNTKF